MRPGQITIIARRWPTGSNPVAPTNTIVTSGPSDHKKATRPAVRKQRGVFGLPILEIDDVRVREWLSLVHCIPLTTL